MPKQDSIKLYLHSTMFLLNLAGQETMSDEELNLHSTMFLLNLSSTE